MAGICQVQPWSYTWWELKQQMEGAKLEYGQRAVNNYWLYHYATRLTKNQPLPFSAFYPFVQFSSSAQSSHRPGMAISKGNRRAMRALALSMRN